MDSISFLENPPPHRVLNRYYGIMENGKIIVGSELRRLTASFSGALPSFQGSYISLWGPLSKVFHKF
jgi:hypothetical protein